MISNLSHAITVAAGQIEARLMNDAAATLDALDRVITQAAEKRVDLLVLPEAAYPAYLIGSVDSYLTGDHLSDHAFIEWLAERAKRYRLHIVSGFVERHDDHLHNSAIFIDERGEEIGRTRKRFLWHVDHDWYRPGESIAAFDSRIGRVGIVICAETRAPEIVGTLVADGAELIAMPTCWINNAREPGHYRNLQVEYLIEARTREFGVPFVCADKTGLELAATGYVGQSRIVRADGSVAAEAPPTGETVIASRLMLKRPQRIWMNASRRERIQQKHPAASPQRDASHVIKVAAVPRRVADERYGGNMGESLFQPMQAQGVSLALINVPIEPVAETMSMYANAFDMRAVCFPQRADVHEVAGVKVGCVAGQWSRSFAASRALALEGAEILMLFDVAQEPAILRARAVENRVFVMGVNDRWAIIIGPDGEIRDAVDPQHPREAIAEIDIAEASLKEVAPKTDVFIERTPHLYQF